MRLLLSLLLPLFFQSITAGQDFRIYLGEDMFSRFDSSQFKISHTNGHPFAESFIYKTLSYAITADSNDENVIRSGLILTAKSLNKKVQIGKLLFGNIVDTAEVLFTSEVDNTTHGRSALVSISNIFARGADKNPQPDPYETEDIHQFNGDILSKKYHSSFHYYFDTRKDRAKLEGWLTLGNDTLSIIKSDRKLKLKNNKIKPTSSYYIAAFKLMKGDSCIAAADKNYFPGTFYLDKKVTEDEKLIVAAFMAIVAAYNSGFISY